MWLVWKYHSLNHGRSPHELVNVSRIPSKRLQAKTCQASGLSSAAAMKTLGRSVTNCHGRCHGFPKRLGGRRGAVAGFAIPFVNSWGVPPHELANVSRNPSKRLQAKTCQASGLSSAAAMKTLGRNITNCHGCCHGCPKRLGGRRHGRRCCGCVVGPCREHRAHGAEHRRGEPGPGSDRRQ